MSVDIRWVNMAIVRKHPLPSTNNLLPKSTKALILFKDWYKNAFHQVEFFPNSKYLTKFFVYNLCARINSKKIGLLTGLNGGINFIDDILVHGENKHFHDTRLSNVLKTLKQNNVLLNQSKCVYNVQKNDVLSMN